ncbi:MAG: helix-turn-helix domain-containing protein [Alphaproteobacteria bacterium]|nr:helix-turn-helix domain-containing protein [Alphaproteobacteria bacterium]
MTQEFRGRASSTRVAQAEHGVAIARSGQIAELVALEQLGMRRSFTRDEEIYAEGDASDCWFKVVSGTVRICKLMADGRRHIAAFHFSGDYFGLDIGTARSFSAEAVGDAVVMLMPRRATQRLIDTTPELACQLRDLVMRDFAHAQSRMLLLGRMTAPERVARFLVEVAERRDSWRTLDLPMSRADIADYLGLTIETVCRVLSAFKRAGVIVIPSPHRIELRDRDMLSELCEA